MVSFSLHQWKCECEYITFKDQLCFMLLQVYSYICRWSASCLLMSTRGKKHAHWIQSASFTFRSKQKMEADISLLIESQIKSMPLRRLGQPGLGDTPVKAGYLIYAWPSCLIQHNTFLIYSFLNIKHHSTQYHVVHAT